MMTRKNFEAVAAVIANPAGSDEWEQRRHIAIGLADVFAADNPNFDRDRFMKACGF